jgi:regulator of replication initiation timing
MYFCSVSKKNGMSSFESLYRETEMNVREAVRRFSELKSKYESAQRENEKLRSEVTMLRGRLDETEEKLKLVELTSTIIDREDKTRLKRQINDWVREIDNSIKLLSEE